MFVIRERFYAHPVLRLNHAVGAAIRFNLKAICELASYCRLTPPFLIETDTTIICNIRFRIPVGERQTQTS